MSVLNLQNPKDYKTQKIMLICWAFSGGLILLAAGLAIPFSASFGYDTRVIDMPLRTLFASLLILGGLFLALPLLIRQTIKAFAKGTSKRQTSSSLKFLLWFIIAIGFIARLLMLWSEPLMEDDYQRYLWDGALSAHGINPYRVAPLAVFEGTNGEPLLNELGKQSGVVLGRVNHPALRTIYPPVTQLAFALAYKIKPFSLTAWRGLAIGFELAALGLLLVLLQALGKSPLWVALYWWNPLVIKELVNSGHMEFLLVPLLLGALWAAMRHRPLLVAFLLALAVGVKIWPALLLPLYLRPFLDTPKKLVLPLLVFAGLLVVMAIPVWLGGLDQSSGFVAYTELWKTNSALVPALEGLVRFALSPLATNSQHPHLAALIVRALIALLLGTLALWTAWKKPITASDFAQRTLLICAAMFLLSPAQLPWYALWFAPFLVFYPFYGLALLVPALQIYYLSFYLAVNDLAGTVGYAPVLVIWLPVWALLGFEFYQCKRTRGQQPCRPLRQEMP